MYEEYKQIASKPSVDYIKGFKALLANDLDTPSAIALIWQLVKDDSLDNKTKCATLLIMDSVLDIGLSEDLEEGSKTLGIVSKDEVPAEVKELISRREAARIARNWLEADTLREAITLKGYTVEDTAYGPRITKN